MADYKELIRKAIQALPENNGAARRAVYEKARAALVGQLRGLNPPLPARDITQHRLQLEDCIRQVEQEASEAVIAGLKQNEDLAPRPQPALAAPRPVPAAPRPPVSPPRPAPTSGARPSAAAPAPRSPASVPSPRPAVVAPAASSSAVMKPAVPAPAPRIAAVQPQGGAAVAALAPVARPASALRPVPRPQAGGYPQALAQTEPETEPELEPDTIEDIIAAAEGSSRALPAPVVDEPVAEPDEAEALPQPQPPVIKLEARSAPRIEPLAAPRAEGRPVPAIVARAEAAKSGRSAKALESPRRPSEGGLSSAVALPERQPAPRPQGVEPIHLPRASNSNAAMSSVSEVDLEPGNDGDPQIAIERAIATLEREARNDEGEVETEDNDFPVARPTGPGRRRTRREPSTVADVGFARAPVERERGGGSAITIFLLVFVALLVLAGGGAIWAWREGFIDFDAMFGKTPPAATSQTSSMAPAAPSRQPGPADSSTANSAAAQTNTEPAPSAPAQSSAPLSAGPAPTPAPSGPVPLAPMATQPAEPSAQTGTAPKSEERLSQSADNAAAPAMADAAKPSADGTPAAAAGSQSLLLEASQDGTTGAVPFSGTVEWSEGKDEMGQPTLVGKASIPARNLGVSVLIRKNSDPTLPASHLMEINFTVNDSFIGGSIAGLPGVLLKNEELVQGTPLVGASARVVGNSFLFALSSSPADEATNRDLLTSRKWIDLAIIYATGKKAIITLEKDDKAEQLFTQVFDEWSKEASTTPAAAAAPKAN